MVEPFSSCTPRNDATTRKLQDVRIGGRECVNVLTLCRHLFVLRDAQFHLLGDLCAVYLQISMQEINLPFGANFFFSEILFFSPKKSSCFFTRCSKKARLRYTGRREFSFQNSCFVPPGHLFFRNSLFLTTGFFFPKFLFSPPGCHPLSEGNWTQHRRLSVFFFRNSLFLPRRGFFFFPEFSFSAPTIFFFETPFFFPEHGDQGIARILNWERSTLDGDLNLGCLNPS